MSHRYLIDTNVSIQIEDLFPNGAVSNINLVRAFSSNVQYGFMIGFAMRVTSSRLSESSIRAAQRGLSVAYRFGSVYLRSSRTIQGRGLRVFNATGMAMYVSKCFLFCVSIILCVTIVSE